MHVKELAIFLDIQDEAGKRPEYQELDPDTQNVIASHVHDQVLRQYKKSLEVEVHKACEDMARWM